MATPPVPTESLEYQMPFGKYKGKPIGYILNHESSYILVFLKRIKLLEPLTTHIAAACAFHDAGGKAEDPTSHAQAQDPAPNPEGTVLNR